MMMMETTPGLMSGEGMMIASPSEIASQKKHRLKSRFQVLRKLGQGTYGKVQLAINKETGQEVSLYYSVFYLKITCCSSFIPYPCRMLLLSC